MNFQREFLNAVGGGVVLDCLDEDEIADMLIDNIYGILQGDEQGVEIEEESEEYEDMDVDGNDISEENHNSKKSNTNKTKPTSLSQTRFKSISWFPI